MVSNVLHSPQPVTNLENLGGECGISFKADKAGRSHNCVKDGLKSASCNVHRGGQDALQTSSDGIGLTTEIPWKLFEPYLAEHGVENNKEGQYAVGMLFLPDSLDHEKYDKAMEIVNGAAASQDLKITAYRKVPLDKSVLGSEALKTIGQPKQIFIERLEGMTDDEFEAKLELVTRKIAIDRQLMGMTINDLCVASLSNKNMTTKALCLGDRLGDLYVDLKDPNYETSYFLMHMRFSTNTRSLPPSAQPVTGTGTVTLAHNGEMNNYIGGARAFESWMHERGYTDFYFPSGISDSNMFSIALEALITREGWSLPAAMIMLNPPSIKDVPDEFKPMLEFFMKTHKPWRGPANLVALGDIVLEDGTKKQMVLGHGDTGLQRPAAVTSASNMFYLGSEAGIFNVDMNSKVQNMALRSGDFIGYVMDEKRQLSLEEILGCIQAEGEKKYGKSFEQLLSEVQIDAPAPRKERREVGLDITVEGFSNPRKQALFGVDSETIRYFIEPMMCTGKDNVIAMGWDVAKPEFHPELPPIHFFIKHRFAQITSSVIDAYREKDFMPLNIDLGADHTVVAGARKIHLESPLLREGQLADIEAQIEASEGIACSTIDFIYPENESLEDALKRIAARAVRDVKDGKSVIILRDLNVSTSQAAIPAFLAVAAVSKALRDEHLTNHASIVVKTAQVYDLHHASILLAHGASAVDPVMLTMVADQLTNNGQKNYLYPDPTGTIRELSRDELLDNAFNAMNFGIQTVMSKMGIDDLRGYQASSLLEADGLNLDDNEYIRSLFAGVSYLNGSVKIEDIDTAVKTEHNHVTNNSHMFRLRERGLLEQSAKAETAPHIHGTDVELPAFRSMLDGFAKAREADPEVAAKISAEIESGKKGVDLLKATRAHANQMDTAVKEAILEGRPLTGIVSKEHAQDFAQTSQYSAYRAYSESVEANRKANPKTTWDLLEIKDNGREAISLDEVDSVASIYERLFMADMSFGALTKIAHTWIDSGFNALAETLEVQSRSSSGEGGIPKDLIGTAYAPARYQVGTAQFGLTADALAQSARIIFKAGQGAKPGMGGELPASKVGPSVAYNRGSTPGSGLSSPPSHDDVKSIEDWTLKCRALMAAGIPVDIKLVSSLSLGPVISGTQKAMLFSGLWEDGKTGTITISGDNGGTAASPITASAHSGMCGFKGLRLGDRALREGGLRDYSYLTSDGGVTNGKDAVRRFMAGADSVGLGTIMMQAVGCIMIRQCQKHCNAGVATNQELFAGAVDDVVDYLLGFIHEIREEMAKHGIKSIDEIIGKTDMLQFNKELIRNPKIRERMDLDGVEDLLLQVENVPAPVEVKDALKKAPEYFDDKYVDEVLAFYNDKLTANDSRTLTLEGDATNCDLAIGAKLSVQIAKHKLARKTDLIGQGLDEHAVLEKLHHEYGKYDQVVLKVQGTTGQEKEGKKNFGSAGQYAGYLVSNGLTVEIEGLAHDSCASGLGIGGVVVVKPPKIDGYEPHKNNIVKNHALLSATGGKFFASGSAGRNFAARNGGAEAVVEGVGDYACKFMGSGTVINLGKAGRGLCAEMAGGVFVQYDPTNTVIKKVAKSVSVTPMVEYPEQEQVVFDLLQEHAQRTGSPEAERIIANWEQEKGNFKVAIPTALLQAQGQIKTDVKTVYETKLGQDGETGLSRGEKALAEKRLFAERLQPRTMTESDLTIQEAIKKNASVMARA